MEVRFEDSKLDRLETDPAFTAGFSQGVVKQFRKRLQLIRSAPDERSFRNLKSLHFEKLKSSGRGEYSMRLNARLRLIVRIERATREKRGAKEKVLVIVRIEDYH